MGAAGGDRVSAWEATTVFAFIGLVCTNIVLLALWAITGGWGNATWKRLRRTYHLTVMLYWLERLEDGGWRVFQKAEQEDKEK